MKYEMTNSAEMGMAPIAISKTVKPAPSRPQDGFVRAFDLISSLMAVAFLLPVFLVIALLIKLQDGGPVLFKHTRIGLNGREFKCLKFRSMHIRSQELLADLLANSAEARAEWEADHKLRNDPRITAFGRFLRKSSLDELPQLFNVLKGEMSLVGPRPIVAAEVERYGMGIVEYRACKPGITGLWQVSGRNDIDYAARVELDRQYARSWSLAKDLLILFRTLGVVARRNGAY